MGTTWVGKIILSVGDWIEKKLSTKEGKITLVIVSSMVTAGSIIYGVNKHENYAELAIDRKSIKDQLTASEKKVDSIQNEFNEYIDDSNRRCNEQIKEGALLHQQLKDIYENRTINAQATVLEEKEIVKERKEAIKEQKKHIKQLEQLSNGKL